MSTTGVLQSGEGANVAEGSDSMSPSHQALASQIWLQVEEHHKQQGLLCKFLLLLSQLPYSNSELKVYLSDQSSHSIVA